MSMGWWAWVTGQDGAGRPRRARAGRRPGVETIEPRVVPSTATATATLPLHAAAVDAPAQEAQPTPLSLAARHARHAPRVHARAVHGPRVHPPRVGLATDVSPPEEHATVGKQVGFAFDTVQTGRSMAYSPQVRKVGVSYAKLGLAHDTRKVGAAYFDAAIAGDGNKINQLSRTRLVKKVGNDFQNLSNTRLVRKVGDAFTSFGRSVADRWNKLF